jgi:sulfide:quinone oxidoreductase
MFHRLIRDMDTGHVDSVAFVIPNEWMWPLPLYELALMTAQRARNMGLKVQITFITSDSVPLKAFGQAAGKAILGLLDESGIAIHTGAQVQVPAPRIVRAGAIEVQADRIVTLPKITGPAIPGIPASTRWFVPINNRCVVPSTLGRVFAAGDATDFPVKHGGIGAQQADTAAAGITHIAGLGDRPSPLHPVIRGALLTGDRPLYVAARLVAGLGWQTEIYEDPPWPAEQKIVADELGAYLGTLDPAAPDPAGAG